MSLNFKQVWISLKTLPLRGWFVQQIVKIAITRYINDRILGEKSGHYADASNICLDY